jgi:hypothetical protein
MSRPARDALRPLELRLERSGELGVPTGKPSVDLLGAGWRPLRY